MVVRVGINGFGRIGRLVFRAAQKRNLPRKETTLKSLASMT